ncbi:recombination mediator RecR [Fulvivirga kasyanovii]|uniref:Recombination protein RecR n=1 Tax=Fulvivirga kasyanovii TaxID=396812 RepID=A0ABW9RI91_9BACT|nr:recombination mediator RecR [Fulvivirga kasyanovii]MTI23713.1 recombination protein RecR [Fulvivirga kasyanovii]
MEYPSRLIENAVGEISKLPGIGKKTALRLVLHLLKEPEATTAELSEALTELRTKIRYCKDCHNISDEEVCNICASHRRDRSIICVVEDTRDVLAIENTAQYTGLYHILGGVISPIEGVGPSELNIEQLLQRIESNRDEVKEVIFALSPTMEGDTTAFYLTKKLKEFGVKISTIARGIPIGGELEYTDEITLGRSILSRTAYQQD